MIPSTRLMVALTATFFLQPPVTHVLPSRVLSSIRVLRMLVPRDYMPVVWVNAWMTIRILTLNCFLALETLRQTIPVVLFSSSA